MLRPTPSPPRLTLVHDVDGILKDHYIEWKNAIDDKKYDLAFYTAVTIQSLAVISEPVNIELIKETTSCLVATQLLMDTEGVIYNPSMDKTATINAAANLLRRFYSSEDVDRLLAELAATVHGSAEPQPEPAPAQPRPENPPIVRTAEELFGASASTTTRPYHKSDEPEFTDKELADPNLLKAADKAGNDRRSREKKGEILSYEELEAVLRAGRFAKQARQRQANQSP